MKDPAAARLSILDIVLITVDIERGGTMRRWVLFLLLFVPATWAFGLDLGLGVSGGFVLNETNVSLASLSVSSETLFTHVPFGAFVFESGRFFMASFGYTQFTFSHELWTQSGTTAPLFDGDTGTSGYLVLDLFAKYPIAFGVLTLSPLVGVEVGGNILLLDASGADLRASMNDAQKEALDQFWFRMGAALDCSLTKGMYLRGELLFSYKFPSGAESAAYLTATQAGFDVLQYTIRSDLNVMIGFKL